MRAKSILVVLIVLFAATVSMADLYDNHDGTVTQARNDGSVLMWLKDAGYAKTSGYDSDGRMTPSESRAWAEQLVYAGYNDWRLPVTLPVNGVAYNYSFTFDGSTDYGENIRSPNSEMAYMFSVELGNLAQNYPDGSGLQPGSGLQNVGPFVGLQTSSSYWSGTQYMPGIPESGYWLFAFNSGRQSWDFDAAPYYAWGVRTVTPATIPVPLPGAVLLGMIGLGYAGMRLRRCRYPPLVGDSRMAKRSNEFGTFVEQVGRLLGVVLFILSTGIMCDVARAQQKLSHSELITASKESCVAVRAKAESKWGRVGTAFFVDPNHVVTCCHVINGGVLPIDPNTKKFDPARWHPFSDVNIVTAQYEEIPVKCVSVPTATEPGPGLLDFAVLELKTKSKERYPVLKFCQDTQNLNVGDEVYFSGFPLGTPVLLTHKGMLSGFDTNRVVLYIQASINKGNSGGALLNTQGEVIGIINSRLGTIGKRLTQVQTQVKKPGLRLKIGGVDPLETDRAIIGALDETISTGIGRAINTRYVRDYIQKYPLMKPAPGTN